ncbi:hypothetical protein PR202_ga22684 [Eleusine coracana subsp. coracana]|uniref:F-box protein n=1 Tax=Eleusine coracana subsp. coracana TaxID=191504 RepID=A0AAV5D2D1_ELECO|nr:hypothetical protein PR202_ga22684 [Eleusine coracana subsp. coracana]
MAPGPKIDGNFDFIEKPHLHGDCMVKDHCNGLVLYHVDKDLRGHLHVCNPITRRTVKLPPHYVLRSWGDRMFLVFDPAVSQH